MLRKVPPGTTFFSSRSQTPGRTGTAEALMTAPTLLPLAIPCRWPIRPKPVMSVQELMPVSIMASAAPLFKVAITSTAFFKMASGVIPCLQPVVIIPVPMGLVSTRTSPGCALALDTSLPGSTRPTTESPYLGSASSTVWPPTMRQPASVALS